MRTSYFLGAFLILFLAAVPAAGRDFTIDDFDPPDPSQAETYMLGTAALRDEMRIVAYDAENNELFQVIPWPLEFVALMAQTRIHQSAGNPEAIADIIAEANLDKPTVNSFAFIIDGDPSWVRRNVAIYYYTGGDNPQRVQIPVVAATDMEASEGGHLMAGWAVIANDLEQIRDFLLSPAVYLVVGEGAEDVPPVVLDIGYWRRYSLFDMREEED